MSREGIDGGLAGLAELLETVSDRLDALDRLAGEDGSAQENRTILGKPKTGSTEFLSQAWVLGSG